MCSCTRHSSVCLSVCMCVHEVDCMRAQVTSLSLIVVDQREAGLGVNTPLLRALRFGLIAVMSIHLQTCIWYAMACPNLSKDPQTLCTPGTWANHHQFNPGMQLEPFNGSYYNCGPHSCAVLYSLVCMSSFFLLCPCADLNVSAAQGQWDKYILSLYWSIATVTVTGSVCTLACRFPIQSISVWLSKMAKWPHVTISITICHHIMPITIFGISDNYSEIDCVL